MTGEVAPGIHAVRVFGADEAARIAQTVRAATGWNAATINAGNVVDRNVRDADVLDEVAERVLIRRCRDRLFAATRGLVARLAPFSVLSEVQIVRYATGGAFATHRDSLGRGTSPRLLSLVCYLNDDFAGGATAFTDPPFAMQPASGIAIAFAPEREHRAEPVTGGTKYAITAWYLDPSQPIRSRDCENLG